MSDYTPTTGEVRDMWSWMREDNSDLPMSEGVAEFDRWLAAHDAAVRADEREKAAQVLIDACLADNQPYEEGLCGHCMVVAAAVRGIDTTKN